MRQSAPKKTKALRPLLVALYLGALVLFCHHFIFRPLILDWGATEQLREMSLDGDMLTNGDSHTRAILIDAPPEEIWPWLIQIGQDRVGFYSYSWLENTTLTKAKRVYSIEPEFQSARNEGDTIWLAINDHDGGGFQIVAQTKLLKSLVMVGAEDYARLMNGDRARSSWGFYLYPENPGKTWLLARSSQGETNFGNKVLRYFSYEVPHFLMERKMLITIQKLVEKEQLKTTCAATFSIILSRPCLDDRNSVASGHSLF